MDEGDQYEDQLQIAVHLAGMGGGSEDDGEDDESDNNSVLFNTDGPTMSPERKRAQHEAWLPFARFLGRLPGLTDLVYSCLHQVPACILMASHQHHPSSRLHVRTFSLRSLYQELNQLHDIDPDGFALAAPPCLYSLWAKCSDFDADGRFSFNPDALAHMVTSGCVPGLKHLNLNCINVPGTVALSHAAGMPRAPWRGFFSDGPIQLVTDAPQQSPTLPGRAQLETLVLSGKMDLSHRLTVWRSYTDFRLLRRLELHSINAEEQNYITLAFDSRRKPVPLAPGAGIVIAITCPDSGVAARRSPARN